MKVIVGLGNPGKEYQGTRHNVGFDALDLMAESLGASFTNSKKTLSEVAKVGDQYILCKPQTFMNNSGQTVRALLDYYSISQTDGGYPDLYVVHDDLDLALGKLKIQLGVGPKAHNGILSMYDHLKTEQFWHVRAGVDNRGELRGSIVPSEYVLKPFLSKERPIIDTTIQTIVNELTA